MMALMFLTIFSKLLHKLLRKLTTRATILSWISFLKSIQHKAAQAESAEMVVKVADC